MVDLAREPCEPCSGDSPAVPETEWRTLLEGLDDWQVVKEDGVPKLNKVFKFKNFADALAFAGKVGELAEEENHHPRLVVEYGRTDVTWWTHAIAGLHRNDFILAARTDRVAS